jgi:hypothetical protein
LKSRQFIYHVLPPAVNEKQAAAHEQGEKQLQALTDISKNIAILVDRTPRL